jgi:hypothetical protein
MPVKCLNSITKCLPYCLWLFRQVSQSIECGYKRRVEGAWATHRPCQHNDLLPRILVQCALYMILFASTYPLRRFWTQIGVVSSLSARCLIVFGHAFVGRSTIDTATLCILLLVLVLHPHAFLNNFEQEKGRYYDFHLGSQVEVSKPSDMI